MLPKIKLLAALLSGLLISGTAVHARSPDLLTDPRAPAPTA